MVRGIDVALPTHFHAEDQFTVVLSGRRRFLIGTELVQVPAGRAIHIPAGTPHRSMSEPAGVTCLNLYVHPGLGDGITCVADLMRTCGQSGFDARLDGNVTVESVGNLHMAPIVRSGAVLNPWETVEQAAQRVGMSREGYSRKFKKAHGIAPHEFHRLDRLNYARQLLRSGETIGAVAAEAGFSDQSHLGRCFRRAFGVTPGQYQTGNRVTSVL